MKIGLILPGFSAHEDDWCIPALLRLVRQLATRAEIHVFTLRYPYRKGHYKVCEARVHALGGGAPTRVWRALLLARGLAAIAAEHRRGPFQVFHAVWADEPGYLAVKAGRLLGIPSVVSLFGGELVRLSDIGYGGQLSLISRHLIRVALRQATCITAGSTYLQRLARPYRFDENLFPIAIGVDTSLFFPRYDVPRMDLAGEKRLLHVASLVPVKDQATLLRCMAHVVKHEPTTHLHLVGDGSLRIFLEQLTVSLNLTGHVTFHGHVSHERLPAYYSAADVCVLSSRHEGQEMVTLEAAACARSSVGTAVGVLADLTSAARTVPVRDSEALAQELIALLQDPNRRLQMGLAAREKVETRFSLIRSVEAFWKLYKQLDDRAQISQI
ncbi:glycosyltransferase [Acidobacteria bacterium AH-259-A15]|nr:glycosyltransferase [Acidobacteria bacterium AH-259-A15]